MNQKLVVFLRIAVVICLIATAILSTLDGSKNLTEIQGLFWVPLIIGAICGLILFMAGRIKK